MNDIIRATLDNYQTALTVFFCLFVLERIRPVEQRQPLFGIAFNLLIAVMLAAATQITMKVVFSAMPPLPFGPILTVAPQTTWHGKLLSELLVLLLYDFFAYWLHRLEHNVPILWRMHKLHHEEEHMNVTTTNRHHPLEALLRVPFVMLPLVTFFDLPFASLAFGVSLGVLLPAFSHMNLRLEFGRLTPLFIGPQLHRLHHSKEEEHHNRNFANIFPIWDVLFDTYLAPQRGQFPPTGLRSAGMKNDAPAFVAYTNLSSSS